MKNIVQIASYTFRLSTSLTHIQSDDRALQTLPRRGSAVMVGYLLKNTVSKYGTVTRGVCRTADDKLTAIHETMKIQQFPDGSIADMADGVRHELDGDSVVSMNFWGFSPTIYEDMERYFHDFLRHVGDDVKAECLLPAMVGDLMDNTAQPPYARRVVF